MHYCMNVVAGRSGVAAAVLIRALEPLRGIELMIGRRGTSDLHRLARGPGCVAQALGVARGENGTDLVAGPLWISDLPPRRGGRPITCGPRIGISTATERPWRFLLAGHPCVSGRRRPRFAVDTAVTRS